MFIRVHPWPFYRKLQAIFTITDPLLISIAFVAAYQTRLRLNFEKPFYWLFYIEFRVAALLLLVSLVCWLAIGHWFKIHEKLESARPSVVLRDTFRQCFLGAICLVLSEFMLRLDLSRVFVFLFAAYSWVLLSLFRGNAVSVIGAVRRKFGTAHFVMVVGSGERARHIGQALEQSSPYGIRLMGFLDEKPGQVQLSRSYEQFPLSALPDLLRRRVIDEIIFAVDSGRLSEMESFFLLCDEEGVRTRVALDFFPHVNSQVYLDALGTTPLLTFSAAPDDEVRLLLKRLTDVLLAAAALVLLLPVMLAIALLITLSSPGRAIFRQERCGLNGRRFTLYKFRSMLAELSTGADFGGEKALELEKKLIEEKNIKTGPVFKIKDDPRVTSVGRFIRETSLDELPQLFNVVAGTMSLVGPRPHQPREVEKYESHERRVLAVHPGITGLAQISGRSNIPFTDEVRLDNFYIEHWSLITDLIILIKTPFAVIGKKGAL